MKQLIFQALVKYLVGLLLVAGFIFVPAGTLHFFFGWLVLFLIFVPMLVFGSVLFLKNPLLLRKRLNSREKLKNQNYVITLTAFMFVAGFVVGGLDFRFGWSSVPNFITYFSILIFVISYILYGIVLKQNPYLSRTLEIQEGQKVVDSGVYSVVRHPMYTASLLMFLSLPLILGSLYSLLIFLFYPFIIVKRILEEEKMLNTCLDGYSDYVSRVKYRLVPYIW